MDDGRLGIRYSMSIIIRRIDISQELQRETGKIGKISLDRIVSTLSEWIDCTASVTVVQHGFIVYTILNAIIGRCQRKSGLQTT